MSSISGNVLSLQVKKSSWLSGPIRLMVKNPSSSGISMVSFLILGKLATRVVQLSHASQKIFQSPMIDLCIIINLFVIFRYLDHFPVLINLPGILARRGTVNEPA